MCLAMSSSSTLRFLVVAHFLEFGMRTTTFQRLQQDPADEDPPLSGIQSYRPGGLLVADRRN